MARLHAALGTVVALGAITAAAATVFAAGITSAATTAAVVATAAATTAAVVATAAAATAACRFRIASLTLALGIREVDGHERQRPGCDAGQQDRLRRQREKLTLGYHCVFSPLRCEPRL